MCMEKYHAAVKGRMCGLKINRFFALCAALMLLIMPVARADGDAIVDDFSTCIVIEADGSLSVEETLTYSVTDSINGFTRDVDPSFGSGYSDFSAARIIDGREIAMQYDESAQKGDAGVYYAEQRDNGLVRYYMFAPCDAGDNVTMVYRYRLNDVCRRYADVGVMEMPLLGDAWEMYIARYNARIDFAVPVEGDIDMLIKSAGMNITKYDVVNGGIEFAGEDAGNGGVFSVRVMFPASALSGMEYTEETDMHDKVLADEAAYQARLEQSAHMGRIALCTAVALMAATIAVACLKWGRDTRTNVPAYFTGAPLPVHEGVGPAELKVIMKCTLPDTNSLAAVMLDLARRGYIDIVGGKNDMQYVRTQKSDDDCSAQEKFALDWIMGIGDGNTVDMDEIRKAAEGSSYSQKLMDWGKMVHKYVYANGWFEKRALAQKITGAALLALAAAAAVCGFSIIGGAYYSMGAMLLISTLPLIIGGLIALIVQKHTPDGAQLCAEWKSVRDWIKGDWNVNDPAIDTAMMERLMVYALPLGVSDKLAKRLDELDPEYADAMCKSKDAMIMRGYTGSESIVMYGCYCSSIHTISSAYSSSASHSGGGSGAGGGGGGGTF